MPERYKLRLIDSDEGLNITKLKVHNKMDWGECIWEYTSEVTVLGDTEGVENFVENYNENHSIVGLNFVIVNYPELNCLIYGCNEVYYEVQGFTDIERVIFSGKPVGSDVYSEAECLRCYPDDDWDWGLYDEKDIKDYLSRLELSESRVKVLTDVLLKALKISKELRCPKIKVTVTQEEDDEYDEEED